MTSLQLGKGKIHNRFVKSEAAIAKGSFKKVFRGRDNETNQDVAWCEVEFGLLDEKFQDQAKEEISLLKGLDNPHILPLLAAWEMGNGTEKTLVLVTEFMNGRDLKRYGQCNRSVICNIGRQILKGLHALHSQKPKPIIHRDLKPSNIFVNKDIGLVKIGDLGLARLKNQTNMKTSVAKGTPAFIAPEMYDDFYDQKVDLYACGMCFLEMATGEEPYGECENGYQIMRKLDKGIPPKALNKVEDGEIKNVIKLCLAKQEDRCTAEDLLHVAFFAENKFKIEVKTRDEWMIPVFQITKPDGTNIEFSYDLEHHTSEHHVQRLIKCGKLNDEHCIDAVTALKEKVEVLLLLASKDEKEIESDSSAVDSSTKKPQRRVETDYSSLVRHPESSTLKTLSPPEVQTYYSSNADKRLIDPQPQLPPDSTIDYLLYPQQGTGSVQLNTHQNIPDILNLRLEEAADQKYMNPYYLCWKEKQPQVFRLVEFSCTTIANEFHAQDLIEYALYAKIVSPNPGSSDNERTTLMFHFIEQKLRSDDRETVTSTWEAFIKALKTESIWKRRAKELEELVNSRHLKEVDVFVHHQQNLILLVQGSLVHFANHVIALGGLTDGEFSLVTDPNSKCQTVNINEMLTAIGNRIKEDPCVFDKVVKIFVKQGAGLKRFAEKHLKIDQLQEEDIN